MKQWILIILVLFLLPSCASRRKATRTEQTKIEVAKTDTTRTDYVKKDSTTTETEAEVVTVQTIERIDTTGRITERTRTTTVKKARTVFDGAVVSERPKGAETVSPEQLPDTYSVSFLEIMLEQTGEDSWIRELLSVMISQYASSGGSEGVAPSPGREDRGIEIPSDIMTEEDEKDPVSFVDDLPEFTPSSESYLTQHGFDGGTSF